jgi:anaerobic selenocysteine-containing dehydrogenase
VPAAQLRTAAEWIGRSPTTVTTCLQGVYQSNQATAAACAVNSMHLLMGKIGKAGLCTDAIRRSTQLDEHARDRCRRDVSRVSELGRCEPHARPGAALERAG